MPAEGQVEARRQPNILDVLNRRGVVLDDSAQRDSSPREECPEGSSDREARNRATALEKEERIERAIQLLGNLGYNNRVAVYKVLQEEFRLKTRQAEQYVAWARERILEHTKKAKHQHREEMLVALESIINDTDAERKTKLQALKQKALLLGLNEYVWHVQESSTQLHPTQDPSPCSNETRSESTPSGEEHRDLYRE